MSECSRLEAIQKICKARKISLKDTVVIGCDEDNIPIFKKAGLSFAVESASTKLKKIATNITLSNTDKAVETVIKGCFK